MTSGAFFSNAGVLTGMVGLGIGLILIGGWLWHRRVLRADSVAAEWIAVRGDILSAQIVVHKDSDGDEYEPQIRYAYRAGGRPMEGRQVRIGPKRVMLGQRSQAETMIAPYRPGAQVTVRYDPRDPRRSVLEARPTPAGLQPLFFMGCFLLAASIYVSVTLIWP